MNLNATILVEYCDLPGFWDVPGTTFELVTSCGNAGGIQVSGSTLGFRVESTALGNWSFCCKAKYPNGTFGPSLTTIINVTQILTVTCAPNGSCDVQCFDEFSEFAVSGDGYYPVINLTEPIFSTGAMNSPNTPDIWKESNGNKFLSFQYSGNTSGTSNVQEFLIVPLNSPIPPGASATISLKALARRTGPGDPIPQTPFIQVFGSNALCATNVFPTPVCSSNVALCATPSGASQSFCLLNAASNLGLPINDDSVWSYDVPTDSYNNLNFTEIEPIYWKNNTSESINNLLVMGSFQNPIQTGSVRFDIDDIKVLKHTTQCACPNSNNSFPIGNAGCTNVNFSSLGFQGNVFTESCLSIEGSLTLDNAQTLTLNSCQVNLGEGAEIIIQNGSTLALRGTSVKPTMLKGCTKLWKSITVQNGGTLDADLSIIQDAQYAIKLEDGAKLSLINCVFDKNYIDLFTATTSNIKTVFLTQAIAGNKFKCTGNLLPPYAGQVGGSTETWTYAAASINNTIGLDITGAANEMWNIRNGVLASKSVVSVKNANIHDLTLGGGNKGISATNFSNLTVENCTINKANYCTYVVKSDVSITKCPNLSTYAAASTNPAAKDLIGVYVISNTNRKTIIKNNTVKAVANGINVNWTFPALTGSEVSDNIVTMFAGGTDAAGIFMNRCSKFNLYNNKVDDPTVGLTYIGLRMDRCDFNTVANNKLYGLNAGLRLSGGNGNYYYNNTVSKNPASQGTPVSGFLVSACTDKFCCNTVGNLSGDGFFFSGICTPTSFRQSKLFACLNGLHLAENGNIGKQEDSRNLWTGPFASGFGAKHESAIPTFIANSGFIKCKPPIPLYITGLGANMPSAPNAWFQLSNNGGALGNCSDCPIPPATPDITIAFAGIDEEEKLATDGYTGTNFTPSLTWMAHQRQYERLRSNTAFMSNSPVLQSFFNNKTPQAIGQYDLVGLALQNLIARNSTTQNQMTAQSEAVLNSASILDSLLNAQRSTSLAVQQLSNAYNTWLSNVSSVEATQQSEKSNILLSNSMLPSTEIWQTNERTLNRVTLEQELWRTPLADLTAITQVKTVADQCPLLGGFAVYQARSIYRSIVSDASWDDNAVCASVQPHEGETTKNKQAQWSVYPNPAGEFLIVECPSMWKKQATFELYNLFGKLEHSQKIALGQTGIRIDTAHLPSGVYSYSIIGENQRLATGKLIISHL